MRSVLIITILAMCCLNIRPSVAQIPDRVEDVHNSLITPLWKMIAYINYRHKYDSQKRWVPDFSKELKALDHKTVTLPGYMVAIKAGMTHDLFLLSVLPFAQCAFCGAGNIPSMVEVHMKEAIPFSDHPIELIGKFVLNGSGNLQSEFYLVDAKLLKTL